MSMLLWILMCSTVMALSEPNDETITNRRNRCRTSSTPLYRRNRRRTSSTSLCDIQSLHTSRLQIDAVVIADAELIVNRHPTSATLLCVFTISLLIAIHYCHSTHASRLEIDAALITDVELIAHRHPTSATFLCDFTISLLIVIYHRWLWFTSSNEYFIVPLLIASHHNNREVSILWIIVAVSELIHYW